MDADTPLTYHISFSHLASTALILLAALALAPALGLGCAKSDDEGHRRHLLSHRQAELRERDGGAEGRKLPRGTEVLSVRQAEVPVLQVRRSWPSWPWPTPSSRRGTTRRRSTRYKSFARLHPTHEKVEDGYVAFKICEGYVQGHAGGHLDHARRRTRRTRPRCTTPRASWATSTRSSPTRPTARRSPRCARRSSSASSTTRSTWPASTWTATTPGRPRCGSKRRSAVTRVGARARAALVARGDLPAAWADPLRAKETFARVVTEYGTAAAGSPLELYLEFIAGGSGPTPRRRPRAQFGQPDGRPWLSRMRTACASWWRAGAPTTPPARTRRPSPA